MGTLYELIHTSDKYFWTQSGIWIIIKQHVYYICGDFILNLCNLEVEYNIEDYVNSLITLSCNYLLVNAPEFQITQQQSLIIVKLYTTY